MSMGLQSFHMRFPNPLRPHEVLDLSLPPPPEWAHLLPGGPPPTDDAQCVTISQYDGTGTAQPHPAEVFSPHSDGACRLHAHRKSSTCGPAPEVWVG